MQTWFESDIGRYAMAREQAWFDEASVDLFGFNAMQFGHCGVDTLRANRMPFRFCAAGEGGALACLPELLPIASQSLDLVTLPHALEFSANPHALLREVDRVLRPEGRLLISGFNPLSLWGTRRLMSRSGVGWPWNGHFIHLNRLKDWLSLLSFEIAAGRQACYAPPINRAAWLARFAFLEAAGDRWWALGGGVYFLHAIKRVHGMRLIETKWSERWSANPVWVPTRRNTTQRGGVNKL
jgi:SAM-dependent methyltransferase